MKAYHYGRFSSKKQEDGNSQARQVELAQDWCKRKGITLDETLTYFDAGRSAFRGANRKKGALGLFLRECEEGRIARGSYLLVESLDRLSRENLLEGQQLIRELLVTHRMKIAVLLTGMEYTRENYQQTHWSIDAEFDRAHSESFHKSGRSRDNWRRRRKTLETKPLTSKLPAWVKVVGGKLVGDTSKADVIRRIFRMSIDGFGTQSIAKKLNAEGVQPITGSKLWHESYVVKILTSRAVCGEFLPRMFDEDGVRVPAGDLIPDYFPRVISEDTWTQNRNAVSARRCERGKITPKVSNLFTGLVFENNERSAYRSTSLVGYLQTARKDSPGVKYGPFERAFLWWVSEVHLVIRQGDDYATAKAKADELGGIVDETRKAIDANPVLIRKGWLSKLAEFEKQHAEAVERVEAAAVPLQSHFLHGQRLVAALKTASGRELETMRRALRMTIRQVVSRVDVVVNGDKYAGKLVTCVVTLKDGQKHIYWYQVRSGRVVNGGSHVRVKDILRIPDMLRSGELIPEEGFPTDPDPAEEIKTLCKRLRLDGKSYKEITAVTSLDRITIYRYVYDYVRPGRKV